MTRKRYLQITCLLLLGLISLQASPDEYLVGTAIGNVTPDRSLLASQALYLGGYGLWTSRGPATDVHDPLSVRAICIERGAGSFCLAVVDSLGIPGQVADEITRLARIDGLPPETAVLVSATHTHAAPDLLGLWGGAPPGYKASLVSETVDTIGAAYRAKVPARLYRTVSEATAHNRRDWGLTDDNMGLLIIRDPENIQDLGMLINFAAHPVTTPASNSAVSSDFVHYLRKTLAEQAHAPAIFVNGTLGDVTPGHRAPGSRDPDYWQSAETYGNTLATAAIRVAPEAIEVHGEIRLVQQTITLRVDNWRLRIAHALGLLSADLGGPIWHRTVETMVSHIRIGNDVEIVTLPGEPLTRFGLDLKSAMRAPLRMIFAQTNDSLGYFVPIDEWETGRNGNYEESVSLGRETAPTLQRAVLDLLR
ncbi:MAG: hypothetical protein ACFHX7_17265 [Pseudomonadota bacterium]